MKLNGKSSNLMLSNMGKAGMTFIFNNSFQANNLKQYGVQKIVKMLSSVCKLLDEDSVFLNHYLTKDEESRVNDEILNENVPESLDAMNYMFEHFRINERKCYADNELVKQFMQEIKITT